MTIETPEPFEDPTPPSAGMPGALVVQLDGFEGPLDLLLALAREQKVDLARISILALADQYLAYVSEARRLRLEVAADYLVMAAWLAYLKSRLLLPPDKDAEAAESAEAMAAALAFQLKRLEAMREAGAKILHLPRLGRDVFARGAPEGLVTLRTNVYQLSLYELFKAYGDQRRRVRPESLKILATEYHSMDDALRRLARMVGRVPEWTELLSFLPEGMMDAVVLRSAVASTFAAGLEMARAGQVQLRQDKPFGPIYMRSRGQAPAPTLVPEPGRE